MLDLLKKVLEAFPSNEVLYELDSDALEGKRNAPLMSNLTFVDIREARKELRQAIVDLKLYEKTRVDREQTLQLFDD